MSKNYSYYPGCSMHSSGKDFEESLHAVCKELGVGLNEIPDWNCCGASATHVTDPEVSYELSLRNLVLAEQAGDDVMTACPACYAHLKHSEHEAREKGGKGVAGNFKATIEPKHLLTVMHQDVGLDAIAEKVKIKLAGLKPVTYYGCLMVRPPEIMEMDKAENPMFMDDILEVLGADVKHWSYKTDCCGGSLAIPRTDIVLELVGNLFSKAEEAGANCVVTACPLCHVNLDTREVQAGEKLGKKFDLPVFYISELMGIAFGSNEYPVWLNRHFVDALPLIDKAVKAPAAG